MAEDPKAAFRKFPRDWIVKWDFGVPCYHGRQRVYRYRIIRDAKGPEDAERRWREAEVKAKWNKEPILISVRELPAGAEERFYGMDAGATELGEAHRVISRLVEAEDPKDFLRRIVPRLTWTVKSMGRVVYWYACDQNPRWRFRLRHMEDEGGIDEFWFETGYWVVRDESSPIGTGDRLGGDKFMLPRAEIAPRGETAVIKARRLASEFFQSRAWLKEAEDPKSFLRQQSRAAQANFNKYLYDRGFSVHRFEHGALYFLRVVGSILFQVEPREGGETVVVYYRQSERGPWTPQKTEFCKSRQDGLDLLGEWGAFESGMAEAEDPKEFFRTLTRRHDWTITYRNLSSTNGEKQGIIILNKASAEEAEDEFYHRVNWGDNDIREILSTRPYRPPRRVREAEDPKDVFRRAVDARKTKRDEQIHLFKDFQYVRSVDRGEEPAMLMALHQWQSSACTDVEHVFSVLDIPSGYAFHQSAKRIDPTHFRTERMFKSDARMPGSDPPFEDLVGRIR